jgi:hypothetical protein
VSALRRRALYGAAALRWCLDRPNTGMPVEPPLQTSATSGGLDVPPRFERALAKAVLSVLEGPGAKADRHKAIIRAYLGGRGWTANRHGNLDSPDGRRRVQLKARVLKVLERGSDGALAKKASTLGRQTLLSVVADEIVAAARRS